MNKIFSTKINNGSFNSAMLLLRLGLGLLMIHHGYQKLVHFNEMKNSFTNFLHLGSTITLCLVIFAELFCSALIIMGLFTRLAALIILINLFVIIFMILNLDFYGKAELACCYFIGFMPLLLCGAGKISIDNMISK